ncbi:transmembrane O-methyltransferase homolog [Thalassophryne amazonica]|uniref:transmembrane O-methyltransferase homolog n=1 Tax=Thalassophryne amazonica TaxID=390379 RepID=UPI001470A42C|nr:transmembrane O-methyltransferase homolog [Thalassophryne amazonica]
MWLMAVSVPLLSAVIFASSRYRVNISTLWHHVHSWALRLLRGRVCVTSTHAFVFSTCTHGNADSVIQAFDLYSETHPSLCIGPHMGEALDEVMRRVRPSEVLELGMHVGYSSVRLLRLLPPAGRLITVECDPFTAALGEEIILVAGFKYSQFCVLTCTSTEAIPKLKMDPVVRTNPGSSKGFSVVLMDHDPQQYLPDLMSLETMKLLCPSGCTILLINQNQRAEDLRETLDYIRSKPDCYCINTELHRMIEVFYHHEDARAED